MKIAHMQVNLVTIIMWIVHTHNGDYQESCCTISRSHSTLQEFHMAKVSRIE